MNELPSAWEWAMLGDVAETQLGKMLSKKSKTGNRSRPYLRNVNVQWHRIDQGDLAEMDFSEGESIKYELRKGDLLVCEGGEVGRTAAWPGGTREVHFQKALHRVRPLGGIQPKFLEYVMRWSADTDRFAPLVTGSTIAHLPQQALRRLRVPIPPLAEQRRIVAAVEERLLRLDAAEAALATASRRQVALSRSILSAANDVAWPEVALGDLLDDIEAGRSFKTPGRPADPNEWGVIKVSAMTWGEFDEAENKAVLDDDRIDDRYQIAPGDLLLSRANTSELVGATVLVGDCRDRLLLSDKSMRLITKPDVDRRWLRYCLGSPALRDQMSAVATGTSDSMRNISQAKVRALRVRAPAPSIQRQTAIEIAERLATAARLSDELATATRRAADCRRSILAVAFSGRLVPQDPSDETASVLLERIAAEQAAAKAPRRKKAAS